MIDTILAIFTLTAPLWVILGAMFIAILVVDGWQ
jgi:hypothetical protein